MESKNFRQVNQPIHPLKPLSTEDILILVSRPQRNLLHVSPELLHWFDHLENSSRLRLALPLWENSTELFTEGVGPRDRPEDTGLLLVGCGPPARAQLFKPLVELITSIQDQSLEEAGLNSNFHKSG